MLNFKVKLLVLFLYPDRYQKWPKCNARFSIKSI